MNSREIVRRTLTFEHPQRVAQSFEPSDLVSASPEVLNPDGEWRRINEREWRRTDEWGNVWGRLESFSKGEVVKGVLENLEDASSITMPDFDNADIYTAARECFVNTPGKWHNAGIHGLSFSIARKMRRMEQYLMDVLLERELIDILHDRVDEQIRNQIKHMAAVGADSVMIGEDWGTQSQLLVSPRLWREMYKPRFAELVRYTHALGMAFFMHSCGQMGAIVPDLIEVGVDVLQFDQPWLHGLANLQYWRTLGKVTFWCPVDIQLTMQSHDEVLIRNAARDMVTQLWRGEGGFIAGFYGDEASIGLDPKWQQIACDEFIRASNDISLVRA